MNETELKNRVDEMWRKTDAKLSRLAVKSRDKIPYTAKKGEHDNKFAVDHGWWTNGFWGGMMWLMYHGTGNEEYKKTAVRSEEMMDEALADYKRLDHDAGFMWHLLSGAHYRTDGNAASCSRSLHAAASLAARYNADGGFIRAWNADGCGGWSIIDCLMNLPLLYRASDETGNDAFRRIAVHHADMALRDHIRSDGSVNHIVEHDVNSGEVIAVHGGQGYGEGSCWSRGLAWAVYGMTISYMHTGYVRYLDAAKRCANYFVSHIAAYGYKTLVDFCAPSEPVYYDSSAGVCTACALIELSRICGGIEANVYFDAACKIMLATDENFCDYSEDTDGLVLMGTERYPHTDNLSSVHMHLIYSDFFFVEALMKLRNNEFFIW